MAKSKVAGGGSTDSPNPMAAIMRGGPQGLPPRNTGTITISSIMNTAPATRPAQIAALLLMAGLPES
ncbi:hypothetical protein GCM10023332_15230 [Luteimonas vadosa]|uniref:Uncharacterized protein n=1 Tax=Luteimonas vadosa TaxID=1165507 RepID=A0ABP9E0S9_9GAMM